MTHQRHRPVNFAVVQNATAGWSDGRNARIDIRWGEGDPGRIRKYAAELVELAPDVTAMAQIAAQPYWTQPTQFRLCLLSFQILSAQGLLIVSRSLAVTRPAFHVRI